MNIILFGNNGQVGNELSSILGCLGSLYSFSSQDVNFLDRNALKNCITHYNPAIIVNAASYNEVDLSEERQDLAYTINTDAVSLIAEECKKNKSLFVHYSTDYVFDGQKKGFYTEHDTPCPINVYGDSKYRGEQAVVNSGCSYYIFRTSWVYSSHRKNFAKTILSLAQKNNILKVIDDQVGVPTPAKWIAIVSFLAIYQFLQANNERKKSLEGLYHLTAGGMTSWYGFTESLLLEAYKHKINLSCSIDNLKRIKASEYICKAQRPANSLLSNQKLKEKFNLQLPDWSVYVSILIKELIEKRFL